MFPKIVVPQIIHFDRVFHYNHPSWGTTIFGNTHFEFSRQSVKHTVEGLEISAKKFGGWTPPILTNPENQFIIPANPSIHHATKNGMIPMPPKSTIGFFLGWKNA